MSENKENDFNTQLKEHIQKYPNQILEQVEQEHGLNKIYDYVKVKKSKLRKKSKTGNTKYSIAGEFYILTVFEHYSYNRAVEKIMEDFNYSNVSGVNSHLQNFKKAMLKENLNERSGQKLNDFIQHLMIYYFSSYYKVENDRMGNAILKDLKKWYNQKGLGLNLEYYDDGSSIPF